MLCLYFKYTKTHNIGAFHPYRLLRFISIKRVRRVSKTGELGGSFNFYQIAFWGPTLCETVIYSLLIGLSSYLAMSSMMSQMSVLSSVTPARQTQLRRLLYILCSSISRRYSKVSFCIVDTWPFKRVMRVKHMRYILVVSKSEMKTL